MSIDLHIHSVFSDGTYTPREIAAFAHKRGLSAISLTDHDTISGITDCIAATKIFNIETVPGIELSVVHGDYNIHLLGYFFDHNDLQFQKKIEVLQNARIGRNERIITRLNSLGVDISMEEIYSVSKVGQTGRPHIATVLCTKGVVKSINDAFKQFLGKGACAYEPRFVYQASEAIQIIHDGGGLAVLAHPAQIDSSISHISKVVDELRELGLDGIEVYYPSHSSAMRKKLKKIVKRHGMVLSGGSDYHGEIRPGTDLAGGVNVFVPAEILEGLRERWQSRN